MNRQLQTMEITIPNGWWHDEDPESGQPDEFVSEQRVLIIDGTCGFILCPDCIAEERVSDADLLSDFPLNASGPVECRLCKDIGLMGVSI